MRKEGDDRLKGSKLGMEDLHKHLFNSDLPGIIKTTRYELYNYTPCMQMLIGPWEMFVP